MSGRLTARLRELEVLSRPEHPDLTAALARRWDELPAHVKTDNQMLGRRTVGCEGTHGVFPKCNLACTPCYHAKEAQRVRTDGEHTRAEVERQMAFLREARGPGQNAQLIGGEVTLLAPDDHAAALLTMMEHGRKPMSMTHGDFDYAYLKALALDPATGEPRFTHLSFAGHFDSMMFGRRGI
jgi:sulfatase maturation enzyme AslB (radical SAM superfamily)